MHQDTANHVLNTFNLKFPDATPIMVASPGRINILGEHTDYNQGYVLPAAIDKKTYLAMAKSNNDHCEIYADNLNECVSFEANEMPQPIEGHWSNYLIGAYVELKKLGYKLGGFKCVFGGDIPLGAGLSSSASIECGFIFGLCQLFDIQLSTMEIAEIGQAAEHNFVGVKCGIMDQFANMHGKKNNAIELNCKTMEFKYHPSNFDEVSFWLFDTCVSHALGDSAYNERRRHCEEGVQVMQILNPDIQSLSDAKMSDLEEIMSQVSQEVYRQCAYVINENKRVIAATDAMKNADFRRLGEIMYTTHEGLSKEYQVSCEELDFLVKLSKKYPAIYGARMMGGGFGGCTINLVDNSFPETMIEEIKSAYLQQFDISMKVYKVNIADGTKLVNPGIDF